MRKLFGTDGIRGEANIYPMLPEVALQVGRAIGYLFRGTLGQHQKVIIGKDTRISGYIFESALTAGLCSMGIDVYLVGPLPTPAIAFLTKDMRARAGIVISASHNPYYDNGIKIFDHTGFKLPDELEERIEALLEDEGFKEIRSTKEELGRAFRIKDAIGRYAIHLKSVVPPNIDFEGLKIAIDCANGACYYIGPLVLEELGAEVVRVGCQPNGININENCGALYPEVIRKKVMEEKCHVGIALDGDGDRIAICDEKGNLYDGDDLLAIFATYFLRKGLLNPKIVVGTVMTNKGLEVYLSKLGIELIRTSVGDRYVVQEMKAKGCLLGGETSGHIIFLDKTTTGDGLLTALRLLSILKEEGKTLSEFQGLYEKFPQIIVNIKVKEKRPVHEIEGLIDLINKLEKKLGDEGRVVVRPSGTEPKYRVMIEAKDSNVAKEFAEEIATYIQRKLE
ncbi:MAG: phosphoglucosamine mutase [Caldimicrobium sp.]|jgi:phosphoglucosamine mutase|nr:phosphoglucosamine mutase [Caldimicrobium sp.]